MARSSVPTAVPEGGWGWVVCLASAWTNGVVFGIINSFGVLYTVMVTLEGATAFKTSWIGSVCAGLTFFMSPFASVITDRFGCRRTAVFGSVVALAGILTSNFATRIEHMYVTYGFTMGLGFAIAYQPSLFILGIYFQRRLGVANGLVCFGSAIFTIALPFVMRLLLSDFGLKACLWFQCSIVFVMLVGSLTFKARPEVVQRVDLKEDYGPVSGRGEEDEEGSGDLQEAGRGCCERRGCGCGSAIGKVIDLSIWKERNFRIWAVGVPIGVLGYFVPFFHLVQHVNDTLPEARAEILIMCLGATSGVGRLVSGFLSDHPKINPVRIQQIAFLVIGVATTLMPVVNSFIGLCALVLIMGLFDGAFVAMMGPIAFNFVGPERASQAIGSILGLMSVPMMIGPPVAGVIYDLTGTYTIAFICSGIPPILCACILFLIRTERRRANPDDASSSDGNGAIMIGRAVTPAMAAKEAEAQAMLTSLGQETGKGRIDNGASTWAAGSDNRDANAAVGADHGRRRSFFRDRLAENDTRVVMLTEPSDFTDHHHHRHHQNGGARPYPNGDVHDHKNAGRGSSDANGALLGDYDRDHDGGCRSPYANRGHNAISRHLNGNNNGRVPNGYHKLEMNGSVHRSDSQTHETSTTLIIIEKETAL